MVDVNTIVGQAEDTFPVVLAGLIGQEDCSINRILILDNGEIPTESDTIDHLIAALSLRSEVIRYRRKGLEGVASARQFLLERSTSPYVLSLDDDVFLYAGVLRSMVDLISKEGIGYVIGNIREPVPFRKESPFLPKRDNFELRNYYKDNLFYPVYVHGGCALYDRKKLENFGGYNAITDLLPKRQAGEDVWVQVKTQQNYGGLTAKHLKALHLIPKSSFAFEKDAIAGTAVKAGYGRQVVADVLTGTSIADISKEYFRKRDNNECISCE